MPLEAGYSTIWIPSECLLPEPVTIAYDFSMVLQETPYRFFGCYGPKAAK